MLHITPLRKVLLIGLLALLTTGQTGAVANEAVAPASSGWISPTTTRVSVASDGSQGDAGSYWPSISADGRWVTFHSVATNLMPGDANGETDVFVHDTQTGQTTLVSVSSGGGQGDSYSQLASVSADGQVIAFESYATNLAAPCRPHHWWDMHVYVHAAGRTTCMSVTPDGEAGEGHNTAPRLSADGRYVAYTADAFHYIPHAVNTGQVTIYDPRTGKTYLASVSSWGSLPDRGAELLDISADARYVVFRSYATDLVLNDTNSQQDIFVHDRLTGQTTRVSVASNGTQANGDSMDAAISANGRYVAFSSGASNLVADDNNNREDVFVHDRQTGETTRLCSGVACNYSSEGPVAISATGQYIVFKQAWGSDYEIVIHNRETGQTLPVSLTYDGSRREPSSVYRPGVSADGRWVVFESNSHKLVPGDTNQTYDIFLRDRGGGMVVVQDEMNTPLPGAQVYRNHYLAGVTGENGTLVVPDLQAGDRLVARYQVTEVASAKGNHEQDSGQNWAYRVYITSLDIPASGEPAPFTVADPNVDQVLTVTRTNTLIGFNILASVEWDADAAYLSQLRRGFELASAYLYDASDGQMLFERVSIFDAGQYWADADFQVRASNQEWPRANVASILEGMIGQYVYLGRYFDGRSAYQGPWTDPNGYRTLIHEFGHYGLGLYDSYYYTATVHPTGTVKLNGHCTSPAIRNNTTPNINATLMNYQYNASELAMRNVSGLWSAQCQNTFQWQKHAKSDWETLVAYFRDQATPTRWEMKTPASHGGVVAGPTAIPVNAWTWTEVGNSARRPICNVAPAIQAIQGAAVVPTATVTLHRSGTGQIIAQGKTDANGRLTILGAGPGDRVHFTGATAAGTVSGHVIINCAAGLSAHSANDALQVVLSPDPFNLALSAWPGSGADELRVEVAASVGLSGTPQLSLSQSGTVTPTAVALHYDAGRGVYTATAILTTGLPVQGILAARAVNTQTQSVEAWLPFNVTGVESDRHSTLWSSDGLAELYLPPGALAADGRVSILAEPLLEPLPEGMLLIGGPYAIRAAEDVIYNSGGNLTLHYSAHGDWAARVRLFGASVYRWDGAAWQAHGSTLDPDHHYAAAAVNAFGRYAILTSARPIYGIYLPLVLKE